MANATPIKANKAGDSNQGLHALARLLARQAAAESVARSAFSIGSPSSISDKDNSDDD